MSEYPVALFLRLTVYIECYTWW